MTKLVAPTLPILAPTLDEWRAMTPAERERLLVEINDALSARRSPTQVGRFTSAVLGGTAGLVGRLQSMVDDLGTRADQAAAQADQALAVARAGVLAVLEARGIACPEEVRDRVTACPDPAILQRWLLRATTARTAAEVVEEACG
jgi:hypothetical protein